MFETKEPPKVCRRNFGYLVRWQVSQIPDASRHFCDVGRLVSPPPVGLRGQERRIGFHEQLVHRNLPRYISQILRFRIRHIARERDQETHLHTETRLLERSSKTVENSAEAGT